MADSPPTDKQEILSRIEAKLLEFEIRKPTQARLFYSHGYHKITRNSPPLFLEIRDMLSKTDLNFTEGNELRLAAFEYGAKKIVDPRDTRRFRLLDFALRVSSVSRHETNSVMLPAKEYVGLKLNGLSTNMAIYMKPGASFIDCDFFHHTVNETFAKAEFVNCRRLDIQRIDAYRYREGQTSEGNKIYKGLYLDESGLAEKLATSKDPAQALGILKAAIKGVSTGEAVDEKIFQDVFADKIRMIKPDQYHDIEVVKSVLTEFGRFTLFQKFEQFENALIASSEKAPATPPIEPDAPPVEERKRRTVRSVSNEEIRGRLSAIRPRIQDSVRDGSAYINSVNEFLMNIAPHFRNILKKRNEAKVVTTDHEDNVVGYIISAYRRNTHAAPGNYSQQKHLSSPAAKAEDIYILSKILQIQEMNKNPDIMKDLRVHPDMKDTSAGALFSLVFLKQTSTIKTAEGAEAFINSMHEKGFITDADKAKLMPNEKRIALAGFIIDYSRAKGGSHSSDERKISFP